MPNTTNDILINDLATGANAPVQLNERIVKVSNVLSTMSWLDLITVPVETHDGAGYYTGDIFLVNRRDHFDLTPNTVIGSVAGLQGATMPVYHKGRTEKIVRQENIIMSNVDLYKIREAGPVDQVAIETANFIKTAKVKDGTYLLRQGKVKADAAKIFSAFVGGTTDLVALIPSGNQPTQSGTSFASAITAIKAGKRSVSVVASELDAAPANAQTASNKLQLIREILTYLSTLGTPNSFEPVYPFTINGINLSDLVILTSYRNLSYLKSDSNTQVYVDISTPLDKINVTTIVASIDGVPVYLSNELDANVAFHIMTKRVFMRTMDPQQQYIGVAKQNIGALVMKGALNGTAGQMVNVRPDQFALQFLQGRVVGVAYPWEFYTIVRA